jgi:beta-galactosidase
VCITPLNYASPGIYLTTKSLDKKKAVVEVKSLISNGYKLKGAAISTASVTIAAEIKDANGKIVSQNSLEQTIGNEETKTVIQNLTIDNPHLWQGRKEPYLYTTTVRVIRDGKTVDEVTQPLGLRKVAITKEQGFLLNGQPYPIYGVCRHQDNRNKGWALSPSDEQADTRIIMDIGATAIRNAHYPQSESWHSLGDRLGLLLWDEVPVVNETRDTRAFWLNTDEQMREMVHQLYNHPSITWWGIYNEIENKPTPPSGPQLQQLRDIAKEIDPYRIIVAASNRVNRYFNLIPDKTGFNYYPGWYSEMGQFAEYIENRAKEVGNRIALSEYGAGGDIAHHTEGPPVKPNPAHGGPFQPEEWQTYVHERDWAVVRNNPNIWGSFLWVIFDFTAANRNEGSTPALNTKGLVTQDRRIKKDAYFLYRANWNPEPTVYITSRRSINRKQSNTEVKVFSNANEVELKVNGKPVGKVKPDDIKVCRWPNVSLVPGKNRIEATGYYKNETITDSCEWVLEAK